MGHESVRIETIKLDGKVFVVKVYWMALAYYGSVCCIILISPMENS
jgi:hypothetical protein